MSAKSRFLCRVLIIVVAATCTVTCVYAQRTGGTGSGGTGTSGGSSSSASLLSSFSLTDSSGTTNTNNGGFVGSAASSGFIGSSSTTGATGNRTTTTRTTTRNTNTAANRNTNTNRTTQGGANNTRNQNQIQPVFTLGFAAPKANSVVVASTLSDRMDRAVQSGRLSSVQINVTEGVAALHGTVANEHDRKVLTNMILLQPGVTEIETDMQIDETAPTMGIAPIHRNFQDVEIAPSNTPYGRPLVHVFGLQDAETAPPTTLQGRSLIHVF